MGNQYLTLEEIRKPVRVHSIKLDLNRLPSWEKAICDLPVGTGIKGGIARKVLKVICGRKWKHYDFASEMNGDGDVDLVVAVPEIMSELRLRLRKEFAGMMIGGVALEAKDIELSSDLKDFFLSRDVTMNECLLFHSSDGYFLYYSSGAYSDGSRGIIRPCVHCLHNGYSQIWFYWKGRPVVASHNFARTIVRMIKGHGLSFALDENTIRFYQENGLDPVTLWRILRPFHKNEDKFLYAVKYLEAFRMLSKFQSDTERFKLWGRVFMEIQNRIAKFGKLVNLSEPDAETIEAWMAWKGEQFERWMTRRKIKQQLGKRVTPAGKAKVFLPAGLKNFPCFYNTKGGG